VNNGKNSGGNIMSHYEKLYRKIKNNPKNVRFNEIDKLLTNVGGFERRNKGTSHYIYSHPDLKAIDDYVNIPYKKPHIKARYIKKAIEKFELANPRFVE
jgi:predicted RNA binding protein YcfA (HicA-like mRNA interferase family)